MDHATALRTLRAQSPPPMWIITAHDDEGNTIVIGGPMNIADAIATARPGENNLAGRQNSY